MAAQAQTELTAPLPRVGYFLLAGVSLFWGLAWPMMKIALTEIPVWPFKGLCLIVGGVAILSIAKLSRQSIRMPTTEIRPLLWCMIFNVLGFHLLSGYGVLLLEAGRASIIAHTMPVWAVVLGYFVLGEKITPLKVLGLVLGMAGLGVLIGPELRSLGKAPLGALLMFAAAVSWALGTVLIKRYAWSIPVSIFTGWQLIAGSIPIILGAILYEPFPNPRSLSIETLAALGFILVFTMVYCQWAWYKVVRLFPASLAAIGTLAVPVIGVFSSALVLGETVGLREILSLALVCSAIFVVLVLPSLRSGRYLKGGITH